jgi:hypothetical protein
MKKETREDRLFIAFLIVVILLAVIYFSVPERAEFFEYQFKWWREVLDLIKKS